MPPKFLLVLKRLMAEATDRSVADLKDLERRRIGPVRRTRKCDTWRIGKLPPDET
jgi:hypothetical protein